MIIEKPLLGEDLYLDPEGARGLVGCWLMNERSGGKVFDLSGNGRTATLVGDPPWGAGRFGSALTFNGSSQYGEIDATILPSYPFTFVAWFKGTGTGDVIISCVNAAAGDVMYGLYIEGSGYPAIFARNTGWLEASWTTAVNDGQWHQIAGVYESNTSKLLYVDGIHRATLTSSVTWNTAVDRYSLARLGDSSASGYFDGDLSHAMIFNRALTASEITRLHREPFWMSEREPIELWAAASGAAPAGIPIFRRRRAG